MKALRWLALLVLVLWLAGAPALACTTYRGIKIQQAEWCCDDKVLENATIKPLPDDGDNKNKDEVDTDGHGCVCGGGREEDEGKRTWLAKINFVDGNRDLTSCSGVLLNRKWLLSAAHCVCGLPNISCAGGENNITTDDFHKNVKIEAANGTWDVERIEIHPEFVYEGSRQWHHPDVALIKTVLHMFYQEGADPPIQPICLPYMAKIEVRDQDGWYSFVPTPFDEDLDCVWIPKIHRNKYPYNPEELEKAVLSCHPGGKPSDKRTHITAFDQKDAFQKPCKTNSYGPDSGVYSNCQNCRFDENPSLHDPVCQEVQDLGLFEQANSTDDFHLNERGQWINEDVGWIMVEVPGLGCNVTCYPRNDQIKSWGGFPYGNGWCTTQDGSWGWCSDSCSVTPSTTSTATSPTPTNASTSSRTTHASTSSKTSYAEESIVDSFLYNTCADDLDPNTEFCVSSPVSKALGKVYTRDDAGSFTFVRDQLRTSKYILREHSPSVKGNKKKETSEACSGSAGGAVWKNVNYELREDQPEIVKATLTGVISRFENECGAFGIHPVINDDGSKRQQNIVSTRILKVLNWIDSHIDDEGNCGY